MNDKAHAAVIEASFTSCQKYEENELVTNPEVFAGWLECARIDRQHSTRFPQPISNAELHALQYGENVTMLMRALACEELRERFCKEHAEQTANTVNKARQEQRARFAEKSPI